MLDWFFKFFFLILSYLLGSIPFGFLFGKMKGIDIRKEGSHNIGATNTGRLLGKKYAILTYLCDMIKGGLFVFLFMFNILPVRWCLLSPMVYGFSAVLGHTFSVFLKFKGGKSVACGSGAIFGYFPLLIPICILIFLVCKKVTKLVSFSSLLTALITLLIVLSLCIFSGEFLILSLDYYENSAFWPLNLWFFLFTFLICLIIYLKHIENIKRILNHTEQPINY